MNGKIKAPQYVTMAFGGNNEAREDGSSPLGDALVTFAVNKGLK
jgi:hypothetical protein